MSNQTINDGVYGFVSGTVGRSFEHKNGRAFEVNVADPKNQYPDRWTVWGDLPVREGDRVSVKGWLSVSKDTYTKDGVEKTGIRRSVNKPEIAAHEPAGQQAPAEEPWATGGQSDDTPF